MEIGIGIGPAFLSYPSSLSGPVTTPPVVGGALLADWDFTSPDYVFTDTSRTTPVAASTPFAAGSLIAGVTDRSGNGHHLTGSGVSRPSYRTVNEENSAFFRGAHFLVIPNTLTFNNQNQTIFVVARAPQFGGLAALLGATSNVTNVYYTAGTVVGASTAWRGSGVSAGDCSQGYGTSIGRWNATNCISLYGDESATGAAASAATANGGFVGIWGDGSNFQHAGHIRRILVYPALSDADIVIIRDFLDNLYGNLDRTSTIQHVFDGDSTMEGVDAAEVDGDSAPYQYARRDHNWPLYMMRNLTNEHKFANLAVGGTTLASKVATPPPNAFLTLNPTLTQKIVSLLCGHNDIAGGANAATLNGNIDTYITNVRSAHTVTMVGQTILPTTAFSTGSGSTWETVNNHIKNTANFDHVIDWSLCPEAANPANVTYYSDGVHPTRALKIAMANFARPLYEGWGLI